MYLVVISEYYVNDGLYYFVIILYNKPLQKNCFENFSAFLSPSPSFPLITISVEMDKVHPTKEIFRNSKHGLSWPLSIY